MVKCAQLGSIGWSILSSIRLVVRRMKKGLFSGGVYVGVGVGSIGDIPGYEERVSDL